MAGKWTRRIGYSFLALLILLAVGISFTIGWRPIIGAKVRPLRTAKFDATPARLARGEYLTNAVLVCFECHSASKPAAEGEAPVMVSKKGAGAVFVEKGAFRIVAPNITPDAETGTASWPDDALARAIREGIGHDGRALFPIMPYLIYRSLPDEDVASVVVYLRTIGPAHNPLPKTHLPFMLGRLIQTAPQPITDPVAPPDLSTPVKRGGFLAQVAGCGECHTPTRGRPPKPVEGRAFSGGSDFDGIVSANITPDASGISYYDEALFLQVMRTGHVKVRALKPPMPWWAYRNMTDEDLEAIYAYLRSLPPVHHIVDNQETPTQCKICGNKHGFGNRN